MIDQEDAEGKDKDDRNDEDKKEDDEEDEDEYEIDKDDNNCCPTHVRKFKPKTNKTVVDCFKMKKRRELANLEKIRKDSIIYMLDEKLEIQKDNILVTEKTITFKNRVPVFNFASFDGYCRHCGAADFGDRCCSEKSKDSDENEDECRRNSNADDYIKTTQVNAMTYRYLPSIPYISTNQGHHLRLNIFHSDLVRCEEVDFPHYSIKY